MEIFEKKDLNSTINTLKSNGIIALPSDTIYGFSCLPSNNEVVNRLCTIKRRSDTKQFILLVSKNFDLSKLIVANDFVMDFIRSHTPNPITFIVDRNTSYSLANNFNLPTIAIRIPNDDFLQNILSEVGVMISTSCNLQGEDPLNDFELIINKFSDIDALVKADVDRNTASTIIDLTGENPKIIRQGEYKI